MNWEPAWWQRAWYGALRLVSPQRAKAVQHLARYEADPIYRAQWAATQRRGYLAEPGNKHGYGGYKNAHSTGQQTPWRSGYWSRSADSELLHDLHWLRNRSREAVRDNSVASGVIRAWVEGVVGAGVEDRSATGDKAKDARIDAYWASRRDQLFPAERISWKGAQRMRARRALVDGEYWVVRHWPAGGGPVEFEVVEADRVQTPLDAGPLMADSEGSIREGIERDRNGRIVAYWVSKFHPGETSIESVQVGKIHVTQPLAAGDFERIPVDDAWHRRRGQDRPGQSRGLPILHSVLQDLLDLDLLVTAVLKRVQVAASFAAFIESPEDLLNLAETTATEHGHQLDQDIVPGMIFKLFPGESVRFAKPDAQLGELDVFVKLLARRIGTALGISWQIVLSDFSQANFSSAKADERRAETSYGIERQGEVECSQWIRQTVLEDGLMRGELQADAADLAKVAMIAPTRHVLLDPEKENKADLLLLDAGLYSRRRIMAGRGIDWDEEEDQILAEQARSDEKAAAAGVDPDSDNQDSDGASNEGGELTVLIGGSEVDLAALAAAMEVYGAGVRAGVLTPNEADENHFRAQLGLPSISEKVSEAWGEEPIRRPVTLSPHTESPLADPEETPAPAVPSFGGAPAQPEAQPSDDPTQEPEPEEQAA